jgi:hypothetical protein
VLVDGEMVIATLLREPPEIKQIQNIWPLNAMCQAPGCGCDSHLGTAFLTSQESPKMTAWRPHSRRTPRRGTDPCYIDV